MQTMKYELFVFLSPPQDLESVSFSRCLLNYRLDFSIVIIIIMIMIRPPLETCLDGKCADLELLREDLCPQDCCQNGDRSVDYHIGILKQKTSGLLSKQ